VIADPGVTTDGVNVFLTPTDCLLIMRIHPFGLSWGDAMNNFAYIALATGLFVLSAAYA